MCLASDRHRGRGSVVPADPARYSVRDPIAGKALGEPLVCDAEAGVARSGGSRRLRVLVVQLADELQHSLRRRRFEAIRQS